MKWPSRFSYRGLYKGSFYNYLPDPSRPFTLLFSSAATFTPINDTIEVRNSYNQVINIPYVLWNAKHSFDIEIDIINANSITGNWYLSVSWKIINSNLLTIYQSYDIGKIENGAKIKKTISVIIPRDTDGICFSVYPTVQNSAQYINLEYSCNVDAVVDNGIANDVEVIMPQYNIHNSGTYAYRAPRIGFANILKGTNAFDFLRACIMNSGVIFGKTSDLTDVYTYDDIAKNGEGLIDWSNKLVYLKEEEVFNQDIGSKNYVKYKASDKYTGQGDGYFTNDLAEKLQKEDKDFVSNNLFSFVNQQKIITVPEVGGFSYGVIPMFEIDKEGISDFMGDNGLWLVKLGSPMENYPMINDSGQVVTGAKVSNVYYSQPTFENIRETNWKTFININQRYRKAKALFMLSGQDIAELDFKRPIYLRQYAQSYILTKVEYQPNGSTVEMVLIR